MRVVQKPVYCAVAVWLMSCVDQTGPVSNSERQKSMIPPGSIRSSVVVPDSFFAVLPASPGAQVTMHTFSDPVYADVWVTGAITFSSNPAAPGYLGPINTTNGPVYAGGTIDAGGGCGLYVNVYYPATYGTNITASPCNSSSASWRATSLFQGTGYATRGGAILEAGRTCDPMPCHAQSDSQIVWIRPLATQLVLTSTKRFIARGSSVTFFVSANPNLMASGGGRPRRVTAWRWKRADPSYLGADTTHLQWYCSNQAAQQCSVPIYENGTMTVDAIVNGVAQTRSITVVVNVLCPSGDTILDDPATRALLANVWSQSQSSGTERKGFAFDSAGTHIYRIKGQMFENTPCAVFGSPPNPPPGDLLWSTHSHLYLPGDSVPETCRPPNAPPDTKLRAEWGPSGNDWKAVWDQQKPDIIIDKYYLHIIYPYPVDSTRQDSTQDWQYYPKAGWENSYFIWMPPEGACRDLFHNP
jgi:hypothetical protein